MKLTQGNLERLVATWKPRLGLDGWRIAVEISADALEDSTSAAEVQPADYYRRARIIVAPDALERPHSTDLEELVVHELLHLATRDIRQTALELEEQVHPHVHQTHELAFQRALEGEVDRLAIALVAAFRP